jgi:hypothetical protein
VGSTGSYFPGGKLLGHEGDHSTSCSAEVVKVHGVVPPSQHVNYGKHMKGLFYHRLITDYILFWNVTCVKSDSNGDHV